MFEDKYSLFLRTYHTVVRNIGLYLSLSLAILTYARYYKGKNTKTDKFFNVGIIVIGLMLLCVSLALNYKLIQDIKTFDLSKSKDLEKYNIWIILPYIIIVSIFVLFGFGAVTLLKEFF